MDGKISESISLHNNSKWINPKPCGPSTSALDAIQVLLGATVGNRRLAVMDFGKHNYTVFSRPVNRGWRLRRRVLRFGDEEAKFLSPVQNSMPSQLQSLLPRLYCYC